MFSLDKYNSKCGIFGGGGGGGVDISGGEQAIKQGTQQGLQALSKYYQEALPYLKDNFSQAQANLAPYGVAGSNSLDELYDTLGIARPEAGSYVLGSALKNEADIKKKMDAIGVPTTTKTRLDPSTLKSGDFGKLDYSAIKALGMPTPTDGEGQLKYGGGLNWNALSGKSSGADLESMGIQDWQLENGMHKLLPLYQTTSTGPGGPPLTANEQAQWDLIQKYKGGQLGMTNPADKQASILQQLQASPGYQFSLQQGLQGVDRSMSARGLLNSGAAVKGATDYSTGLAQNTYNNRVQQLAGAAGLGQQAAGAQAGYNAGLGTGLANMALGTGSNIASLYGSQASGLAGLYGAQAQANAQSQSSQNGLFGDIIGAGLGMFKFSDKRLKKNLEHEGRLPNGINIYSYNYIWEDTDREVKNLGVIAQEILETHPEAVAVDSSGYYKVDYSKLGVR